MINDVLADAKEGMQKSVDALTHALSKLRTGRAHPGLLEHVSVNYYGTPTPLSQVANVTVENARMLTITPWEKSIIGDIEKAILKSDLGLNPSTAGTVIRVPLPPLTEERRKALVKLLREEVERARISIRNVRRDANQTCKELEKEKEITEDDVRRSGESIQKQTDQFISKVDALAEEKEKDLMEI
jgi:ribosome recycling factor